MAVGRDKAAAQPTESNERRCRGDPRLGGCAAAAGKGDAGPALRWADRSRCACRRSAAAAALLAASDRGVFAALQLSSPCLDCALAGGRACVGRTGGEG